MFIPGDQFVGLKVDPNSGDLVLRYVMVVTNKPDANGRGVTTRVMEMNKSIARGRPLIFAPDVINGGTRGHTDFRSQSDNNPYKYEVGRIVNIEPASKNLFNRLKQNLIQTNSSYINLLESEKNLWVSDVIITNEEVKKILLNPATSHLIPRYVSPSFIHRRNPNGDYSRVDDAVLDHIAIVNKPMFDPLTNRQIDGAAYGEDTRLRGACFGEKVACLNLLQTSSNVLVELDKCVSCPVQLLDRLTNLYKNLDIRYIEQTSSDVSSNNSMSENNNNNQNNQQQGQGGGQPQTTVVSTQGSTDPNQPSKTQTFTSASHNPLASFFQNDETIQNSYGVFKNMVTQVIKENPNEFKNVILADANPSTPSANNPDVAGQVSNTPNQNTDNVQTGETPQQQQQQEGQQQLSEQLNQTLAKLKITEDEFKTMKLEDLKKKFGDVEGIVKQVIQEQMKTTQALQKIKDNEEKGKIANILPKEAFTDDRGFKQKEFEDMVSYLYKKGLDHQYIALIGVGLATLKNEQIKVKEQQINIKNKSLPQGFGESLKNKLGNNNEQQQQQQQPLIPS